MNVEYDPEKETFEVLIGFNEGSFSSETTGGSTKTGKFKEYYREVKTAYSLIGENNQEFSSISRILKVAYTKGAQKWVSNVKPICLVYENRCQNRPFDGRWRDSNWDNGTEHILLNRSMRICKIRN